MSETLNRLLDDFSHQILSIAEKLYRFLIRVSAFIGKEIFRIIRQPMLMLTLVLGPFLIMLLFGIGFRNEPRALRTLFVINQNDEELATQIRDYATSLGPQFIFSGVTPDRAGAMRQLARGEIDLVAVVPEEPIEQIRNSQAVDIELYHYEIDPLQVDYISVFGEVYIDELNRRILQSITTEGQQEVATVDDSISATRETLTGLRTALETGDQENVTQQRQELSENVDTLALALGATMGVAESVQGTVGGEQPEQRQAVQDILVGLREDADSLEDMEGTSSSTQERERIDKIETDLNRLETTLEEFQDIDSNVLVRPFRSQAKTIAPVEIKPADFYAPSVIALLLQHLAVTFAALSIIQERRDGTVELFRVSPISAIETLLGKYISYFLFIGIVTLILTLAIIYGLQVPMIGSWLNYTLTVLALIFASLGIGFVISLIAKTDTETVQYSMIILLTSVFFSGAFLSLHSLWQPVRVVSWLTPATYAILMLQNIMLRGVLPNLTLFLGLAAIGISLFFLAWFLLSRLMTRY